MQCLYEKYIKAFLLMKLYLNITNGRPYQEHPYKHFFIMCPPPSKIKLMFFNPFILIYAPLTRKRLLTKRTGD